MSITEKLIAIQQELKAPKGQYNSFGKYSYRSCEDILEAVKPLLVKNECFLIISDQIKNIGERYYIEATASLTDGSEKITVTGYAREEETKKGMDGSQITGATSSYARKYALNGLFCIDDQKDSDATNTHGKDKAPDKGTEAPFGDICCAWCAKPINATTYKGKNYSIDQIVRISKAEYKVPLHIECIEAWKEKNNA